MENKTEEWDICPNWDKNFKCEFLSGEWRLEGKRIGKKTFGKCIFTIRPIGYKTAPTFADQRNFFTGLIEADFRNDNFAFEDGVKRPAQTNNTISKFRKCFDDTEERTKKGVQESLEFYIKKTEEI